MKEKKLHSTKNYDMFSILEFNRKVDENHIKHLIHRLEMYDDLYLHPIIVNSEMEIIDGQHRFEAAKRLDRPVYYLIDDNYDPFKVISINTSQKGWLFEDYLNYWVSFGKEDYIKVASLQKKCGFRLRNTFLWLLSSDPSKDKDTSFLFKNGLYKYKANEILLELLEKAIEIIKFLDASNIKPKSMTSQSCFHYALKVFLTSDSVDVYRFIERLKKCIFLMKYKRSWPEYLDTFVNIYNYHMRKDLVSIVSNGREHKIIQCDSDDIL